MCVCVYRDGEVECECVHGMCAHCMCMNTGSVWPCVDCAFICTKVGGMRASVNVCECMSVSMEMGKTCLDRAV